MDSRLIQKYNVPGPRYTSYPTVPYWETDRFSAKDWISSCRYSFAESNDSEGISLYIHLPYCESMCTFCGCHKRITKRHEVEDPYIDAVLKEWQLYADQLPGTPNIREIHFGGGTPTFFSPENLQRLIDGIFDRGRRAPNFEFSFEGHPNSTTSDHLRTLRQLGFTRVSYGVQDYSPTVQKAINRIQSFERVAFVTQEARALGYTSVSHDLVYGLPFQKRADIVQTINKTIPLMPDRIALYSYAHVPWIKGNGQRGFDEKDLPNGEEKRELYETAKMLLLELGYEEIGMDHFALPGDRLYQSMINGRLHRNFMGYTASKTQLLIGLGASSISDSWFGFAQNEKNIEDYLSAIQKGQLPVFKGHMLNEEDLVIRQHILNLMCQHKTCWDDPKDRFEGLEEVLKQLKEPLQDHLVVLQGNTLKVTETGKAFVRNICMAFDLRLHRHHPETQLFSMTI